MLCGRSKDIAQAYLPLASGCVECAFWIDELAPCGVPSHSEDMQLFQSFCIAPRQSESFSKKVDSSDQENFHGRHRPMGEEPLQRFAQNLAPAIAALGSDLGVPIIRAHGDVFDTSRSCDWQIADCSNLGWSGTAKDIRTLGILAAVADSPVRHLVAWTAGNAGLSLARALARAKGVLRRDIEAHLIVTSDVSDSIIGRLKNEGAIVTQCDSRTPLSTSDTVHLAGGIPDSPEWLDVTDGWDESGVLFYRLYAYWLMSTMRPNSVVVPVGTGGLFIGFALGISDYIKCEPVPKVTLIGAIPAGFRNSVFPATEGTEPAASKLIGSYSPFGLILAALREKQRVVGISQEMDIKFIPITREQQVATALSMRNSLLKAEPSALIAAAAAKTVMSSSRNGVWINTGFGLQNSDDEIFCQEVEFLRRRY